jgi:hypothetical protein
VTVRTYGSPAAFKEALEHRLRAKTPRGTIVARTRQLLVFERFLARVVAVFGDAVTIKGGVALELRIERARTTRDVDLRLIGPSKDVLARLQQAARLDLGDFLTFEIVPDADHPAIEADGMKYDGQRFRAECSLAGKIYGQRFGVDVAFGDPIFGESDAVLADDVLGFAGIAPPTLRLYPIETHIAEKLHAYTLPRKRPNSRIKDLPDLGLLAGSRLIDAARLRGALEQTFTFRATHDLPPRLPEPPIVWARPYAALARDDQLGWPSLEDIVVAARAFLDPVLQGQPVHRWDPSTWSWS